MAELVIGRIVMAPDGTRMLEPLEKRSHKEVALDHQQRIGKLIRAAYRYKERPSEAALVALKSAAEDLD